jgi:tetratricopeptide (TPR) repeat protein
MIMKQRQKTTCQTLRILWTGLLTLAIHPATALEKVFPLTENTWNNPEFVDRFMGTYTFDLNLNPKLTKEEGELFQQVAQVANNQPAEAKRLLRAALGPEASAAIDFTLGSLELQTGNATAAERHYKEAIRKFPNFYRAYQNLGLLYVQRGTFNPALDYLTKALEIGGGNGGLYGLIGYSYLKTDRPMLALDAYRQALLVQPDSKDWRLGKLNALLAGGLHEEASATLEELILENPDRADFWLMQTNAFLSLDKKERATANLEMVRRLGQAKKESLVLLGNLYLDKKMPLEALEVYQEALQKGDLEVARSLAIVRLMHAYAEPALTASFLDSLNEQYAPVMTPEQKLAVLNHEAEIALALGQDAKAAEILAEVVRRDPLNGAALLSLARYFQENNEPQKALARLDEAASLKDFEFRARVQMARIQVSLNQYREALDQLRRAQAIDPRPYIAEYIDQLERVVRASRS